VSDALDFAVTARIDGNDGVEHTGLRIGVELKENLAFGHGSDTSA
jgi:hypothetical protein